MKNDIDFSPGIIVSDDFFLDIIVESGKTSMNLLILVRNKYLKN